MIQIVDKAIEKAKQLYNLNDYEISETSGHEGGRNLVYTCSKNGSPEYVLRLIAYKVMNELREGRIG